MVCSYSIYLVIMYFNPGIERWLYKITNTSSPEYKSDLHASNGTSNGKSEGYSKLATEEGNASEKEKKPTTNKQETLRTEEGIPEVEKDKEPEKNKDKDEEIHLAQSFEGNNFCSFVQIGRAHV